MRLAPAGRARRGNHPPLAYARRYARTCPPGAGTKGPVTVTSQLADMAATVVTALDPADIRVRDYLSTLQLLAPASRDICPADRVQLRAIRQACDSSSDGGHADARAFRNALILAGSLLAAVLVTVALVAWLTQRPGNHTEGSARRPATDPAHHRGRPSGIRRVSGGKITGRGNPTGRAAAATGPDRVSRSGVARWMSGRATLAHWAV